uniref:Vinculin n=1 Tax=Romanomermis culicivorax TaxID=13658 RepID=A0A915IWU1_ROMCU
MKDNEDLEAIWERVALSRQHKQIFDGARDLHSELTQWSTKHNDMVAAAIRVSILMAKLSQLVWCEIGTKKDLIACSKAVANASEEVTEIALQLAAFCPDLKIRKSQQAFHNFEKILAATSLRRSLQSQLNFGAPIFNRNEVEEAMQQLVFNAENLMKCVKNTVKVAETASLKIQTDTGLKLKWIPKS